MANFDPDRLIELPGVESVDYSPTLDSTSDRARQLLGDPSISLPLLVVTDIQTAGRGQPGNQWLATNESLTFTWCVNDAKPNQTNEQSKSRQALMPLVAGLTVCETLESLGIESASIKWPNDVLIGQNKVAGILVETIPVGQSRQVLIGIGLNVNQRDSNSLVASEPNLTNSHSSDSSTKSNALFSPTSLFQACNRLFDIQSVLISILDNLHRHCNSSDFETSDLTFKINQRFAMIHKPIQVQEPNGKTIYGICQGVGIDGHLLLSVDGVEQKVFSGSIVG